MEYPHNCTFKVPHIFGNHDITINLYSNVTVFIGANGTGKTQTLKEIKKMLIQSLGSNKKVRYLSSNRIGLMEQFRSWTDRYNHNPNDYIVGSNTDKALRHSYETSVGDFFTLDEKKDVYIKVSERLSVMFKRHMYLKWDSGNLKVFFERAGSQKEYSVAVEASGLVNIISILAALYDNDTEVLLIDEPEVSLHPQLQSYLLREIINTSKKMNKTVIISTHSPEMIPFNKIQSISNLVFFSENSIPIQIQPDSPELQNRKLKDFVMRMSQIYKTGFFAKKILLVEGVSDLIISKYLSQRLDMNIDVAGSQVIPSDGKGQFAPITKLFRMLGKDIAIMTDLDGFIDDNNVVDLFTCLPLATEYANSCGCSDVSAMIHSIKTDFANLIEKSDNEDFKNIYEKHPYWKFKETGSEADIKAKKRAIMASLFSLQDSEINQWPNNDEWKRIKTRLTILFDILEHVGCFILRKGAIESYYKFASNDTYEEKPSKASEEVGNLDEIDTSTIETNYSDIVRALKYVAMTDNVDEAVTIKKELLSEIALVLDVLPEASNENDLYAEIKRTKGGSNSLFDYEIIENKNGVKVTLKSDILNVNRFPFDIHIGDNVNELIKRSIS